MMNTNNVMIKRILKSMEGMAFNRYDDLESEFESFIYSDNISDNMRGLIELADTKEYKSVAQLAKDYEKSSSRTHQIADIIARKFVFYYNKKHRGVKPLIITEIYYNKLSANSRFSMNLYRYKLQKYIDIKSIILEDKLMDLRNVGEKKAKEIKSFINYFEQNYIKSLKDVIDLLNDNDLQGMIDIIDNGISYKNKNYILNSDYDYIKLINDFIIDVYQLDVPINLNLDDIIIDENTPVFERGFIPKENQNIYFKCSKCGHLHKIVLGQDKITEDNKCKKCKEYLGDYARTIDLLDPTDAFFMYSNIKYLEPFMSNGKDDLNHNTKLIINISKVIGEIYFEENWDINDESLTPIIRFMDKYPNDVFIFNSKDIDVLLYLKYKKVPLNNVYTIDEDQRVYKVNEINIKTNIK